MKVPIVWIGGVVYPTIRYIDGVEFYLAFDSKGRPFYSDVRPN